MKKQSKPESRPESVFNNILITGIDGFTGQYLEKQLTEEGYNVFGTTINSNKNKKHFCCDIRNYDEIANVINTTRPNFIFHLAGISFVGEKNRTLIYDVNVIGTENLLEAVLNENLTPEKIIIASSATVYGNQNNAVLDETMCPKPLNHYGYSKLIMEHLVATYFQKLNIIITRPFNYTGPLQDEIFLIPKIVSHFKRKEKTIELGNIHVAREFNHISDISELYIKLMKCSTTSSIVNLCSGKPIYLNEIIEILNKITGYLITVKINESFVRKNEVPLLIGSTNKLKSIIDYEFKMEIEDTLKDIYFYNEDFI